MNKLVEFLSSKMFRNAVSFLLFTFLLTLMISSQNYFFQKIIENGISKKDIIAQKDIKVIDTIKTEQHRKDVAQNVEPVLAPVADDFIINSLTSLKNSVIKIRSKQEVDSIKREEISILFNEVSQNNLANFLLRASDESLQTFFDNAQITLTSALNRGIASKDIENNKINDIILKNIPNRVPKYQRHFIIATLNQVIVPNLVIDEFATEIAKKNAQNAVKVVEVEYKKGDYIIRAADPVSKLQKDALRAAGYNVLEVNYIGILGIFVLVSFFTLVFLQYERNFEKNYYNTKYMTLMASFTLFLSFIAMVLPTGFSPYIIPLPAYTMFLSVFTTPRNAFFGSTILLALLSIGMHWNIEVIVSYMLLNTVIMTSISKLKFSKRSDLLVTSLKISASSILIVGGIYFLEKFMMDIDNILILTDLMYILINCFIISGVFVLGALPIIENVFRVMTPYGLAELADYNQPLLKKLMEKASGTYSHSLIVSQLCEAAAEAIGANAVLARVGAMYHDIGKLLRPMFFVENQSFYGIENPHNSCTPRFSKMLITAHPKDGLELAKEAHLPQDVINFITQHHGTSLVSYFYNEALKEEGVDNVNEEQFRYPGPKPNMKETAILMIADAVESAVRAAKSPSAEEIDSIIAKIIKDRLNDGQLADSPLTLKELKVIGETLSRMLRGMHHERIKYHNDIFKDFEENTMVSNGEASGKTLQNRLIDKELENKLKELENKKNEN